ncbi:MAG: phosphoglycerate kinase [Methanobacteriaceae archaeon]|jgi:phosphoglycerate kinase|nr:phosphoglycerate kinase [Candidatus Methanorudis spinitermitis]
MTIKFNVINDFNVENKTVLVRIDINSPVDPNSGLILDDTRMKLHSQTIKELSNKGAKTVLLAHQSRPGKKDFTTLKQHAEVLSKNLALKINYTDSIFSSQAINTIKNMEKGEIVLLENVRFFSEESISKSPEEQSKILLIQKLAPLFDLYVNDAFAAAHRSQPSLVGFTEVIPSAAGLIMESELKTINAALESVEKPCVFVLGGMKADDSIDVMKNVLKNETADFILTTGLVANIILLAADVNIGDVNKQFMKEKGYLPMVEKSRKLLKKYKDKIIFPTDLAIEDNDERRDVAIDKMPNNPIFDIGIETIKDYAKIIRSAKTIFANGPAGVFENSKFAMGTEDLLNAIATSEGFSIIGGGHIAAAAVSMGFDEKMDHISSGGGACINLLAGKKLVAVDALVNSAEKFKNNI